MALFDAFHALSLRQRRSLRNSLLNSPFVKVNKWIYWSTQITKKDINQLNNSRTGFWGKMHPECKCPHWYPATQKASGHEEQDSTNAYIPHWAVVHSPVWRVLKRWNCVLFMLMDFEKYFVITEYTDTQRWNKKQSNSDAIMKDSAFTCWVSKLAHCKALVKFYSDPICDSENQQVKNKGKPQATQPYLRSAWRKNLIVVVRLHNFHVTVKRCQTKGCRGNIIGEYTNWALNLA